MDRWNFVYPGRIAENVKYEFKTCEGYQFCRLFYLVFVIIIEYLKIFRKL